jgi:hypothetical protein
MSKDKCEFFYRQIKMNHLTLFLGGQNTLFDQLKRVYFEATILYNDSQHNIPALQGRANKPFSKTLHPKWCTLKYFDATIIKDGSVIQMYCLKMKP